MRVPALCIDLVVFFLSYEAPESDAYCADGLRGMVDGWMDRWM